MRVAAGLSAKDVSAAKTALQHSIFAVALRNEDEQLVGMGRIKGDGGYLYHIVDIAVEPAYQGKGFGKVIMSELTRHLDENAPKGAYVSLFADVPADGLYKKYGFAYTAPKSEGMYKKY
ncbi:GNAT family N-acetyltransferase [Paenibacillus sp. MMS18-CY102]|uniref:GNAT family N-acetyltransferase n=1 Tax=Paenibacillus sp. MMS18-CY102 TaxID=2682849 RepID=UPI0013653A09|nr:GNAT family N-acetyltransferase [Paenibacillus sp. MMS18-CY102]MWC29777.1 GNAT family N-acetyltransferase [Paenibacillus sp. MMS18-CY102]